MRLEVNRTNSKLSRTASTASPSPLLGIRSRSQTSIAACVIVVVVGVGLLLDSLPSRGEQLTEDDRAAIMKLADRLEVVFLEGRDVDLPAYVRPEQGLFIDLWGDWDPEGESTVHIAYKDIDRVFNDYAVRVWGSGESGRPYITFGPIPYVLLYGWRNVQFLDATDDEENPVWSEMLSLPEMMRRYDSKCIDELTVEPLNHSFAYGHYHYVQYWLQDGEQYGDYWFLIVDKDEHGWFLKGLVHMDRWVI